VAMGRAEDLRPERRVRVLLLRHSLRDLLRLEQRASVRVKSGRLPFLRQGKQKVGLTKAKRGLRRTLGRLV